MIKKVIPYLMFVALLFSVGCAKTGDLDELQDQLENQENQLVDLENRLEQSQSAQQAALLAQIEGLLTTVTALEAALDANDSAQSAAIAAQLAELEALKAIVAENGDANAIYYGNVISGDQYDEVLAQGASIVTGDVIATADMFDKLVNVKLVGGNLLVNSELTLASLEVVVGSITVNEMLVASALTSAGHLMLNASMEAPELTAVTGDVFSYRQEMFEKFMAPKLSFVNAIDIEGVSTYGMNGNILTVTDFKVADGIEVVEDFKLRNVVSLSDLVIGNVAGEFTIDIGRFENITYTGETVGDFKVGDVYNIVAINAENLITANSIDISGNFENFRNPEVDHGLYYMNFDNLVTINGTLRISGNGSLLEFDTFNSLTEIKAEGIEYQENALEVRDGGSNCVKFNAFNELVDIEGGSYSYVEIRINSRNITAFDKVLHVNNFKQLHITSADDVAIFANLETVYNELDMNFTGVAGTINSLSNFKHFKKYSVLLEIRLPYNQEDIAAHMEKNSAVYAPFCEMIQGATTTLSADMKTVTSKFTYLQNGTTQKVDKGTFKLYKNTGEVVPYVKYYDAGWKYDETQADPYWAEGIAGITSSCTGL